MVENLSYNKKYYIKILLFDKYKLYYIIIISRNYIKRGLIARNSLFLMKTICSEA